MAKYQQAVQTLLDEIGGKANIQAVSHCMTRMRFVLVDPKKANEKAIEAIPCVKGTFTQAGQYQVIIGNDVATFYQEFTKYAGIEGVSRDAVKSAAKTNQNPVQRVVGALGEIFAPIIPALICGGLILGFRNLIGEVNLLNGGTQLLTDVSQFWAGLYNFLWLIGEAIFHFLPVGITWSITKKMGTTQILGIVLGLTLISPQLLNGFSVATTAAEDIPVWDFGFAQVQMIGYQGQVIAAILAGFVLVYLEKFFQKICPEVIRMVVVPFCALVPAVLIAHTVVGPIGWKIGDFIANIVNMGLASNVKLLFAALFGLPGILSIFPEYWVNFLLAMLTAIIVPFVLTIVVGSRKLGREERGLVTAGAPAPADAEITVVMADTKHACDLRMNDGTELLIHVGVDTVDMGGDGFTLHVSEGDKVRRGDALITFDANKIAAAGHPTTTMLIVTDPGAHSLTTHTGREVKHGETPVAELG